MKKLYINSRGDSINLDKKPQIENEIATRERVIGYDYMYYLPDPDPVLRNNGKDVSTYREIMNDAHVGSVWEQRVNGTLELLREIDQNECEDSILEFYKELIESWDFENLINEILEARFFGLTVLEIVWLKFGNYLLPGKIIAKPQEWFVFGKSNELRLKTKNNPMYGEEVLPYQFLLVQNKPSYLNPYGKRLASRIFWYQVFKKGGLKYWVKFTEKYGMPYAISKVPAGLPDSIKTQILNSLNDMIQDNAAVIPDSGSVELLTDGANSKSAENYKSLLEFCNSEISKAILTQTLTTEIQGKGTYSAAQVHGDQLEKLINADKRLVENTINKLFSWINDINFRKTKHPKFALYREEEVDKTLAERDVNLKQIGIKFNKTYFVNNYGLNEDEFDITEQSEIPPPPVFQKKDSDKEFSEPVNNFPDQQRIDEFVEMLLSNNSELAKSLTKMIQPVIDLVEQSESLEQIKDNLAKQFPDMKSKQFEKALQKVLFISENFGRLSVEEESK